MLTRECDVAVVGSGPNGLTAAAYLARAGARVVMLEKRFERGGTLATDDYSTPFQYNLAQFELPLADELPPYRDLELHSQGVRFIRPEIVFSSKLEPDGEELTVGRGGRGLGTEIEEMLAAASARVLPLLYRSPSAEGLETGLTLADATPRTLAERATDPRAGVVLRYACGLAGFLDGDVPLGLIGAFSVARLFSPAIVVGGSKNLANGLARVAAVAGVRGLVSSGVTHIERSGDGFRLRTALGGVTKARAVVSTLDPRSTFLDLMASGASAHGAPRGGGELDRRRRGSIHRPFRDQGRLPAPRRRRDDGDSHLRLRRARTSRSPVRGRDEGRAAGDGCGAPHRGQRP